jgi:hypothetical protein
MADVFDIRSSGAWSFAAEASTVLATTSVALVDGDQTVRFAAGPRIKPKHDFSQAGQVPAAQFNRVLWKGLMGRKPYPTVRGQATNVKDDD